MPDSFGDIVLKFLGGAVIITAVILLIVYVLAPDVFSRQVVKIFPECRNTIDTIRFKDAKLNELVEKVEAELILSITNSQTAMCSDMKTVDMMIDVFTSSLESKKDQLNAICKNGSAADMKAIMIQTIGLYGIDGSKEVDKMSESLINLFAYAVPKMFCEGEAFSIKSLGDYLKTLAKGLCDKDSGSVKLLKNNMSYFLRRPLQISGKF